MFTHRLRRRLSAAAAVLTALLTLAPAALAAASTAPAYFTGATAAKHARPTTLALSADGTLMVDHITWISWGGTQAIGSGTAEYHGCTPDCAAGTPHLVKVAVVLSQLVSCSGTRYYNHVALERANGTEVKVFTQGWAPCRH